MPVSYNPLNLLSPFINEEDFSFSQEKYFVQDKNSWTLTNLRFQNLVPMGPRC